MPNVVSPELQFAWVAGLAFSYVASPEITFAWEAGFSATGGQQVPAAAIAFEWEAGMSCVPSVPVLGAVTFDWLAGFSVQSAGPMVKAPSNIRSIISDVLALWGFSCCQNPKECVLAAALRSVNEAVQQFSLSARSMEFLIHPKERSYSFSPSGKNAHKFFSPTGVDLPDVDNIDDLEFDTIWTTRFHHVSRVVWVNATTGKLHHLRPVRSNHQAAVHNQIAPTGEPGSTALEWLDTPVRSVPLYYEVFRDPRHNRQPKIRGYPWTGINAEAETEHVNVTYYNCPELVTAGDYYNGASLDIAQSAIELYIMPLARYAALSSIYFDSTNESQREAVKARYAEVAAFLTLGDIQSPAISP